MEKYEARAIEKGTFNGQKVKMFELWKYMGGAWIFAGRYVAPIRTANKRLVEFALD